MSREEDRRYLLEAIDHLKKGAEIFEGIKADWNEIEELRKAVIASAEKLEAELKKLREQRIIPPASNPS